MVEGADCLDDIFTKFGDLEFLGHQVEVEEGADGAFFLGVAERARVEPADEELEGLVVHVGEAEGLGLGGFGTGVEGLAEEGRVVAEQLFVEDPVGGVWADVKVDHCAGEESAGPGLVMMGWTGGGRGERTHGEAFRLCRRP